MKADWKKVRLDEMGTVSRGRSKHRPRNDSSLFNGEYPFIQTADVKNANLYITEFSQTYNEKGLAQSKLWNKGTLCITIAANIADTAILGIDACFPDSIMGFIPNTEISDVKYVKYCFDILQKECQSISVGAAQDNLSWEKLSRIKFSCPPLETQQKIASILSAYDDLIENNRKQIKLLEEAAQRLYKEWFVDLRFSGYENVAIMDGVPEGWRIGTLGEIGEFKRGKTITRDTTIKGDIPVVAGGLEPAYYHNESNTESPVITVSGSGANAGFTRMYNEKIWASDCSFLDFSKCKVLNFIYCILKSSSAIVDNLQKGAAQPHVYAKDINALKILIPNNELIEKFEYIINTYFFKIKNCQLEIKNAQQACDKLLPRLMSGEMEV